MQPEEAVSVTVSAEQALLNTAVIRISTRG